MRLRIFSSIRFSLAVTSVISTAFAFPLACQAQLKEGDCVAICGDSITEQKLYSLYMADYLLMCQPEPKLEAVQFGWSGETSWGFLPRMKADVLPYKPTVATTCYGMNDGGYAPLSPDREKNYRASMDAIVKTFKDNGVRFIVVGTPGAVDTKTYARPNSDAATYNKTLSQLGAIGQEIAKQNGVAFADVHSAMLEVMEKAKAKYGEKYHVAGNDGVHPSPNGHLVMAYAFLKALGCSGEIGTITYDAKSHKAEATSGHKVLSSDAGKISVESTKYPFCFSGSPEKPESTAGVIEFFPFNQDLNRFLLVVKNAPSQGMKVTWGPTSKTFTADQLAQGVNLAAEFLNNPFSEPFKVVEKSIAAQQAYETLSNKNYLHSIIEYRTLAPEQEEFFKLLTDKVVQKAKGLQAASTAAVKPVQHSISLEAIN